MKLFLDDERIPPEGWIRVRWPEEAIDILKKGKVTELSLDHDLGDDAHGTGYDVILWIEQAVATEGFVPPMIAVHSANPPARQKMEAGIRSIQKKHAQNLHTLRYHEKEKSLMSPSPTVDEIRNLEFEWPKYTSIEKNCVMDGLQVDLFRTIGKLMKALAELEDLSYKATEVHRYGSNETADQTLQHQDAIRYLRRIQAAFEKRELGPADLLAPAWSLLGIANASEARALTIAEVDQWLGTNAARCAWTESTFMQLRWLSRNELEEVRSALLEPSDGFPAYGYMASEWRTDEGERFLLFHLYYWPV